MPSTQRGNTIRRSMSKEATRVYSKVVESHAATFQIAVHMLSVQSNFVVRQTQALRFLDLLSLYKYASCSVPSLHLSLRFMWQSLRCPHKLSVSLKNYAPSTFHAMRCFISTMDLCSPTKSGFFTAVFPEALWGDESGPSTFQGRHAKV